MTFVKRFSFLFIFFVFLAAHLFGQGSQTAQLVDEFGRTSCEATLARTELFAQTLRSQPSRWGVVVVYGSDINSLVADLLAGSIHRYLLGSLGLDAKVTIIRSHYEKALDVQLWIAPDASSVKIPQGKVVAAIPFAITKRTYFADVSGDPCTNQIPSTFARVVNSNPRYIGQIVNFNIPRRKWSEVAAQQIQDFRRMYDLPRNKLRIFFKEEREQNDPFWSNLMELWISPN